MKTLVFPGSFDPITYGHIDLIKRASVLCDELVVLVVDTKNKIDIDTRVKMVSNVIKNEGLNNVIIDSHKGLLVDYMNNHHYSVLIRGIRDVNDLVNESILEQNNKELKTNLETIYMQSSPEKKHISSSMVWEILEYDGEIKHLVPDIVRELIEDKNENI